MKNSNQALIDNALAVAQGKIALPNGVSLDCANAHFGVLRQYSSLSFATLRTEAVVNGSLQEIGFNLNRFTKQATGPGELLLEQADGFIATHLRISLIQCLTGEVLDQSRQHFFANPRVFTGTTTTARLNAIYQGGRLVLKVGGNDWNKEGLTMKCFEKNTSFNQGLQVVADTADETLPVSAYDGIFDGAVALRPGFMFGGVKENTATVKLAQATLLTNGTTATTENILCFEVLGVYMPGVAAKMDNLFLLPTV